MLIDSRALWAAQTNTYVLADDRGSPAIVVDAPPDIEGVSELLARHDLSPVALVVTHGHVDHAGGAGEFVRRWNAVAWVHSDDDFLTLDPQAQLRGLFGFAPPGDYQPPDRFEDLRSGEVVSAAGLDLDVLHTPGHTPGHCCFYLRDEGVLFGGDQLFAGSIGRTDLPGGDYDLLMSSMEQRILPLGDDVVVHPGHGPSTTIGRERTANPFLADLAGGRLG